MTIKGEGLAPREIAKILGVIMDSRLWYQQYIARAETIADDVSLDSKATVWVSSDAGG